VQHPSAEPEPEDDRDAIAIAMGWATALMTISVEMVLPGLLGYWLDKRLGFKALFVFVGFACGMTVAVWHLIRITAADSRKRSNRR